MSNHKKKPVKAVAPMNWYFMCPNEISVSDIMKAASADEYEVEIWPEAGVLEIEIEEKMSMDIEECELDMGDEFSNDFIRGLNTQSLFYITFKKDIYDKCLPILKNILSELGGKICADSEDFTPEIR